MNPHDEVILVAHNPVWAHECKSEKMRLQAILGALILEIQHTGSTAVPGLLAKPIIDILVADKDVDLIRNDEPMLQKLG